MNFESLLSMSGLGEFVDQDFFVAQIGLLSGSVLFFVLSFVFCIMAFRSALAARQARSEAKDFFQSAEDLAVEVRHLTAQVEQTMQNKREPVAASMEKVVAASVPTHVVESTDNTDNSGEPLDSTTHCASDVSKSALANEASEEKVAAKVCSEQENGRAYAAGENTLSFVDGDEGLLKEPSFVGEGVPSTELLTAKAENDLATQDEAGQQLDRSPLSSLLRRRRY